MTSKSIMKGLLGATALTILSTGTAFAQNNFTAADTEVSNSFTLDYNVLGVPQPQIETETGDGTDDDATTFRVDRLVNVTVASSGSTTVAPGQQDAELSYTVTNDGNDTHAYFLGFEEVTNGTGDDDIDTDAPTSTNSIIYFVDTNGNGVLDADEDDVADEVVYDPSAPPVLDPDATLFVVVRQDIPTGANDDEQADIILFADTRDNAPGFASTDADNNTVNDPDVTENVLADLDGPGNATNDGANDGAHSAQSFYLVSAADITADKTVQVLSEDASACTLYPGGAYTPPTVDTSRYYLPGACIEYTINVANDGTEDATAIVLSDVLPDEILFVDARLVGSLTGTLSEPTPAVAGTSCAGGACTVGVTAGGLVGKATAADPAVTGAVVIRALIP